MKKENVILEKSFAFALNIVAVCRHLMNEKKEYILAKQLLRSGTSIGANTEEAIGGQSRKDFVAKLSIAYKEARETHYWIRLLTQSNSLEHEQASELRTQCEELMKILGSILKTTKSSM